MHYINYFTNTLDQVFCILNIVILDAEKYKYISCKI